MSEFISRAKLALLTWWLVLAYIVLFTVVSLATAAGAALTGKDWHELSGTDKFIIGCMVIANWGGTMLSFINQAFTRIKQLAGDGSVTTTTTTTLNTNERT
jgi:TRAP-type C4-dicarboxylate transport system permease small subunit